MIIPAQTTGTTREKATEGKTGKKETEKNKDVAPSQTDLQTRTFAK